jgi:outer membrane protein TolC
MRSGLSNAPITLAASLAAVLALSGCGTTRLEPLTAGELARVSAADRQRAQQDVEPLGNSLTLEEALARAIKYNLGRRTRLMEEALAQGQLDVVSYDMLPKLVASAGYRDRDNDLITRSTDSVTGQPSLAHPFISSSRSATTTSLGFTWSLLDFGQSYYAARQHADRVLIAAEHRRKALHNLVQDVETAFWRAASAQTLRGDVRTTIAAAEEALRDSRQSNAEGVKNPLDALRFQRQVMENLRLLELIEQELSTARIELAALINAPLTADIKVVEPDANVSDAWKTVAVDKMEELVIANNAELRESFYNARVAQLETRRTMLKLFPGLSFNYGVNRSNDSYLIHQNWTEAGAQLSFNLLGMLSAPAQMRLADAGVAVADQRRVMTQMIVLTQMHLARLQYQNALQQYQRADGIWKVDRDIAAQVANREAAHTQSKLDVVANQTAAILSALRRYQALSQFQAAAGRLQASLGLEPDVGDTQTVPLATLTATLGGALRQWNAGNVQAVPHAQ